MLYTISDRIYQHPIQYLSSPFSVTRCVITITSPVVIGTMSSADGNLVIKCPPEVYFVARSIVIPMLHASQRIRAASQPRLCTCSVLHAASFRFRVAFSLSFLLSTFSPN